MKFHYSFVLHRLQVSNSLCVISSLRILYPSPYLFLLPSPFRALRSPYPLSFPLYLFLLPSPFRTLRSPSHSLRSPSLSLRSPSLSFSLGHAGAEGVTLNRRPAIALPLDLIPRRHRPPQSGIFYPFCSTTQLLYLNSLPSERYYFKVNSSLHFERLDEKELLYFELFYSHHFFPRCCQGMYSAVVLFRELCYT